MQYHKVITAVASYKLSKPPATKTRIEARSVTWAQKITVSKQKEEVEYRGKHHRIALLLRTMN